jgi:hypothetical protein
MQEILAEVVVVMRENRRIGELKVTTINLKNVVNTD